MGPAIGGAGGHDDTAREAGSTVTPQGTSSLPCPASPASSSRLTFALRFVSPVTTGSGKGVPAVAVGLGSRLGGAVASWLARGDGTGPGAVLGTGLSQAAMSTAIAAIEMAGSLRRARTARIGGAVAAGTT